jgi:hypothetical protein
MSRRLNVSLDDEQAEKLARLAARTHVAEGTLARSLLSAAIDDADPDAATVTRLLARIPGFAEGMTDAQADYEAGNVIELRDL